MNTQRRALLVSAALLLGWGGTAMAQAPAPATRDLTIDGIAATWTTPAAASFPAVLIIAGSGPTDRDGNNVVGLKTDAYKLLATALAERGIASLRFDKRGVGGSKALIPNADAAKAMTIGTFVGDAERLAAHARAQPGVTSLSLIGHSEGGLISLLHAGAAPLDGIVLLTASGRSYADILLAQLQRQPLPVEIQTEAIRVIDALSTGRDVGAVETPLDQMFSPVVHGFLRSVMRLDPIPLMAKRTEPILVIGGGKDIQVGRIDFDALAAARPARTTTVWLDAMAHVLKAFRDDDPAQTALYRETQHPLMPGLADRLADWIKALPR